MERDLRILGLDEPLDVVRRARLQGKVIKNTCQPGRGKEYLWSETGRGALILGGGRDGGGLSEFAWDSRFDESLSDKGEELSPFDTSEGFECGSFGGGF